jgi:hypothetical protein
MAYASTTFASPNIRMPSIEIPKPRWPRLSPRARALLMMALVVSPCFLADAFGYCVKRLFLTANEIAEMRPSDPMLARFRIFQVACPKTDNSAAGQERWAAYAAQREWPPYPPAGAGCFNPDRSLRGVPGLIAFSVACPVVALAEADQRRWIAYASEHNWTAYPQAGAGCVDP